MTLNINRWYSVNAITHLKKNVKFANLTNCFSSPDCSEKKLVGKLWYDKRMENVNQVLKYSVSSTSLSPSFSLSYLYVCIRLFARVYHVH